MKKFCLLLNLISLCVVCLILMSSCAADLDAPKNLKLNEATQTLSWNKCKGASGYTILIGDVEVSTLSNSYSLEKLEPGDYIIKVKARGDGDDLLRTMQASCRLRQGDIC